MKGINSGSITDIDGNYKIEVSGSDAVLVYSYIGYITQVIPVGDQSVINVDLPLDVKSLTEVVVIGYGTQDKKEVTSAIASIGEEEFNKGNVNSPAQLLQGKVAGLTISKPGNNPNGDYKIRLRGLSTFGANQGPLIVIDGVVGADLNAVDPNDIATMDVLKDGSAAAIYGTRGSSGVIMVTTKTGKKGKSQIDYNGYVSAENIARTVEVMNSDEFKTAGGTDNGSNTDWFDELTSTALTQVHNVSMSGGSDKTTYRASFNFRDVEGVAINTGFKQLNGRLNITQRAINDKLALTVNLSALTRDAKLGFDEAFRYATIYNPTSPTMGGPEAENYGGYWQEVLFDYYNPVAIMQQNENDRVSKKLMGNIQADFEIIEGLNVLARYSQQFESLLEGQYFSKTSFWQGADKNGKAKRVTRDYFNQLFEATATYQKDFGDLNISLLGGYSYQEFINEGFDAEGGNFITDAFGYNNLGAAKDFNNGLGIISSFKDASKLIAGFARVNLSYDGTYYFSASIRREGSTRFGEDKKWGNFPAVSAGVTLSNLMNVNFVNSLKLRASYGVTGNLPKDPYLSQFRLAPVGNFYYNGDYVPSFGPTQNPNPILQWESKKEFDIGIDFALLDNRLNGTIDFYNRDTDAGIFEFTVPQPPNFANKKWVNVGKFKNQGIEAAINYLLIDKSSFTYQPGINFATFSSELISLSEGDLSFGSGGFQLLSNLGSPGQNNTPLIKAEEGKDIGQLYGKTYEGLKDDGTWKFKDFNNDGNIDTNDESVIGNGLPKFELGFSNMFTMGNFDLNVFFRGTFGHDLINTYRAFYESPTIVTSYNATKTKYYDPNLTSQPIYSSYHIENASFFKLDNMTLGYNVQIPNSDAISKGICKRTKLVCDN